MAVQFLGTRYQSLKDDGTVNAGGSVYFYETGTSTAKTTYSDSALTSANANPVVLNSAGCADIWYSGDADVTVKDSAGTTIDTYTSINPAETSTANEANLIVNGSFEDGASTTDPDGWVRDDPYSGGTSVQDTDSSHGLYSWKFVSVGSGGGVLTSESFFNVTEGRPILVTWMMKSTADVRNLVEILWYDDADAYISATSAYDDSATNPTSWTLKSYTGTPVSTAVKAKIRITGCHSSDATPGTSRFDGMVVSETVWANADNTFTGTNTFGGSVLSTKAAASGYSRVSPNMCRIDDATTFTALTRDTITLITGPTGAKGLILQLYNVAQSNNAVANRYSQTDVYSDSGGTTTIAQVLGQQYEHVGVAAGTTLAGVKQEVHVKCDSSYRVWVKFTDDTGNQGLGYYQVVGYYD